MNNPWEDIKKPSRDVITLRIDPDHPLDLFWGKDYSGKYMFIYEYPEEIKINKIPKLIGVEIALLQNEQVPSRLVLILNQNENWEIFLSLCEDLIKATEIIVSHENASLALIQRLTEWQYFLKNKPNGLLSEQEIRGLIGELFFLKKYLIPKFGPDSIKFWIGPEGALQDFHVNNSVIEVKSKLGVLAQNIRISSANQLYTKFQTLYLYVVTLGKSTNQTIDTVNLPALIEDILRALTSESYIRFQDMLLRIGYHKKSEYSNFNYLILNENTFNVVDGFPRINLEVIPAGISKVSYDLQLDLCKPFEIQLDGLEL